MAPTTAFLVLLALMSNPFCFHQNGIIWAPNAPLLTLQRPILVIAACFHILYAGNTHNNHKIASLCQTSRNHVRFKLHPKTNTPCWSGNKASLFIRPLDPVPATLELELLPKEQKQKEEEEAAARKKAEFEKREQERVERKRLLGEQRRKEEEEAAARKKAELEKREREIVEHERPLEEQKRKEE